MGTNEATPVSKTRMNTPAHNDVVDWHLVAERRFDDIEELNELVQGWDFEFHQLKAGRSPAELLQLGRPEFMLTRFYFEQPYHQRGCTAQEALTIGLTAEGIEEVTTPNGAVKQDDILCFPAGRELSAVSRPRFTGYSLSIAEALLAEVAESCGRQVGVSIGTVQQVRHCSRANMNALRHELRRASQSLAQIKTAENSSEIMHDLEFTLIRHLLLAITDSRPTDRLKLTNRKQKTENRKQKTENRSYFNVRGITWKPMLTNPLLCWSWHRRRGAVCEPWNMFSVTTSTLHRKPT